MEPVQQLGVAMITEDPLSAARKHPDGLVVFEPTIAVLPHGAD